MARPKLGDSESRRLQMVITEDELDTIDTWQHENRVASRSEAIRRLVQIGVDTDSRLDVIKRKSFQARERLSRDLERTTADIKEARDLESFAKVLKSSVFAMTDAFATVADLDREISALTAVSSVMKGEEEMQQLIKKAKEVAGDHERMMRMMPLRLLEKDDDQ